MKWQEQVQWDGKVEVVVVLGRWKRQLIGEEGQGDGSDWEDGAMMTTRNLCWNQQEKCQVFADKSQTDPSADLKAAPSSGLHRGESRP